MKQWILKGSQGAKSLQLEEVPTPEPGDYEILVKFHAASLNFRDLMIINVCFYLIFASLLGYIRLTETNRELITIPVRTTSCLGKHFLVYVYHYFLLTVKAPMQLAKSPRPGQKLADSK